MLLLAQKDEGAYPSDIILYIPKLLLHIILGVSQTVLHVMKGRNKPFCTKLPSLQACTVRTRYVQHNSGTNVTVVAAGVCQQAITCVFWL